MRKWIGATAAMGLLALGGLPASTAAAASAASTASAAEPAGPKVIRVGATQAMDSMNPFLAVRLVSSSIHRWPSGFLTVPDAKTLKPSPDLAES